MSAPYYEDELITLYHGDCLEVTEWLAADVLVTDPPYGRGWRQGNLGNDAHGGIANDESTAVRDAALSRWGGSPSCSVTSCSRRPAAHNRCLYSISQRTRASVARQQVSVETPRLSTCSGGGHLASVATLPCSGRSPGRRAARTAHRGANGSPSREARGHHAATDSVCPPGVIADPFAGSGSTLVAAKALGRRAICVELEERYCEIAARRLAQDVLDFSGGAS